MERRYVGVAELAKYIGIAEGTIRVWTCYRRIPFLKIGRCLKFDLREIETWLKDKRREEMS